MTEQSYKGSFILKILIVLMVIGLAAVIYYPNETWKDERKIETLTRQNMAAIYEAQIYYYSKTKSYVGSDSLEKLITFIQTDTSLQKKQKIGQLTVSLHRSLENILAIPLLKSMLPISQSLNEISDELNFNSRYFTKYDHIMSASEDVVSALPKFSNSGDFPNFCIVKTYVDSLNYLKERINDYKLQNAALEAQRYLDSLMVYANNIELNVVNDQWKTEYDKISSLVKDIKKTDIMLVSTVADRTKKFGDRIKSSMQELGKINFAANIETLHSQKEYLEQVYQSFISSQNFLVTQNSGQLKLNEIDSTLIKLNESNFYSPDTLGGRERYVVHFQEGNPAIIIESPKLLRDFQSTLIQTTEPLRNLSIYSLTGTIKNSLDTTIQAMNAAKDRYKLNRSTEVLLAMKELIAEMQQDMGNVKLYSYTKHLKSFVDTVQTERRLSALKPMIEDILNPMDTLAANLERADLSGIVKKLDYFGGRIRSLDSLVQASSQIAANVKREVPPFYPTYEKVYDSVEKIRTTFNPQDAQKIREASGSIETALLEVLNGYEERVNFVFYKKHKNYGYIDSGTKSWEE